MLGPYDKHPQLLEWLEGETIDLIEKSPVTKRVGELSGTLTAANGVVTCVFNRSDGTRGGGVWSAQYGND